MNYRYSTPSGRKHFNLSLTFVLVVLNAIAFVVFSVITIVNPGFISYIALSPSNIFDSYYFWTFFSSMFMHAGFFHLFANMLSLVFIGNLIEKIIGKKRFLAFYLASGLFAGIFFVLLSLLIPSDFNAYAVGASGAIFGLAGLLVVLTPNLPVYVMFIPIPIKMKYAVPGLLAVLWLISIAGNVPIGNTAHLGGLLVGLLYGIFLKTRYKNKTRHILKVFS
jgi:membrane associated rhomboid family serine protease